MHEPFLQLVKEVAIQGRESAAMYGCRGWTLHHNTDIWRSTGAVDGPKYGIYPLVTPGSASTYGIGICSPAIRTIWQRFIRLCAVPANFIWTS